MFTLSTSITPGVQGLKYRWCSISGDCHSQIQRFHVPSLTSSVLVKKMPAVSLAPRAPGLNFAALTFQGGGSHGTWRISRSHLFSSPCATNSNVLLVRKEWRGSESPQGALQSHLPLQSQAGRARWPAPPMSICVTSSILLNLSQCQSPWLQNALCRNAFLLEFLWEVNTVLNRKHSPRHLVQ